MLRILTRKYHQNVLKHFNKPENVGSFDKADPKVGTALVGSPACGDLIKFQIKVENDIIVDCKFKTFGCGSAISSSDVAAEWLKGTHINCATDLKNNHIADYLHLPPVKLHCSLLTEDAIKMAVQDYKYKNKV